MDAAEARRWLTNHGWRAESAITAFLSRSRASSTAYPAAPPSPPTLLRLERAEAEAYGDL